VFGTLLTKYYFKKTSFFKKYQFEFILISGALLAFSAFMTTKSSAFIWDNFGPLQFLQFPWRFLTFTTLFSAALAGGFIFIFSEYLKNLNIYKNLKFKNHLVSGVFSLIVIIGLFIP